MKSDNNKYKYNKGGDRKPKPYSGRESDFRGKRRVKDADTATDSDSVGNGAVIGRNAVRELLKSGRAVDKIMVQRGEREGSIVVLVAEAVERGIPVIETEKAKLDKLSSNMPHQGVVALAAEKEYVEVEDILKIAEERGETPLIVISDGITDPYNLGALIRCAEGVGAHGLIIPKRRAVGLTPLVSKASAENGGELRLDVGIYTVEVGVGNLAAATWLSGSCDGDVMLKVGKKYIPLEKDVRYLSDGVARGEYSVAFAEEIELRLSARGRADFGEIFRISIKI